MYMVKNYIGPNIINNIPPPPPNFGANRVAVDTWIRGRIIAENLQMRAATFPMELWCMTDLLAQNLCRTNNSVEGFHHIWNTLFCGNTRPKVSTVVKKMKAENSRWYQQIEEFNAAPANGIRGQGQSRKAIYVQQDNNLRLLYQQHLNQLAAGNADIVNYLRNVSHQLGDYQM